jgi:hypothetical protein
MKFILIKEFEIYFNNNNKNNNLKIYLNINICI